MATFTLNIHGDLSELADIAARLGGETVKAAVDTSSVAAEKPTRAPRAPKAAPEPEAVAQTPVVQPEPEPAALVESAEPVASAPGEITLDHLKDELGKLLKKEGFGAEAARDLIRQHGNGATHWRQVAATDYAALHAALVAANV